jgi:serralysin
LPRTTPPPAPPPPSTVEHSGSTALLQAGSDYFLNPSSNLTTVVGPELMFNGAPVTVGMWTGWNPVAAEQTSGGYDVAFFNASTGLYNIWSVDSTGHYISNLASGIAGTSATLENFETTFQQDLNGDGTIGLPPPPPPTTIEAHGVTALLQSGSNYFLNPVSSGSTITGPELLFNGAPVTVGMWTGWNPVAAEQTSGGYDVAFFNASTGLFNIWSVDSTGHYISNLASGISGSSSTLQNFETIFNQDLNLNGSVGSTAPLQVAANSAPDNFHFASNGGTPSAIAFSAQPNGGLGQGTATPDAPAILGHDSFVFAPSSPAAPALDLLGNATFANNHAGPIGLHQDAFSINAPQDPAHVPLWLAHHGDFHLI